jgi:acyl-CoA reductase-like NAD-dependent aldehyde dehydrogenase
VSGGATVEKRGGASADGVVDVRNPATGEHIASLPATTAEELERLVAAARQAQPAWAELGVGARCEILKAMRSWLAAQSDRVVGTLVSETGKTHEDAQLIELSYCLAALSFWAAQAPSYLAERRFLARTPLVLGRRIVTRYVPRGVVGVIGPWNYPLINSFGDCIPALAAGNSVILKPSELTPLTSLLIAEGLAASGVPDGVFGLATGGGETGGRLIDLVDFVMFTGSAEIGRTVAERAARSLTPFALELGGKDAMIVLEGADLERAANVAVYYAMANAGQACVSIERVYAEDAIYDRFLEKLTRKVAALRNGPPTGPGSVDVGAITTARQLDIIEAHVADALAKGARVVVGGKRGSPPGRFFEPTLLVDVDHTMACMTEETFGPTLPLMRVADAEEAISRVNDSRYGLGASVFARDVEAGERIARRLQVGSVCVDDAAINYFALAAPMGGVKESGIGVRHGAEGLRKFTTAQTIVLAPRWVPRREPQMYPFSARRTRLLGRIVRLLYGRRT